MDATAFSARLNAHRSCDAWLDVDADQELLEFLERDDSDSENELSETEDEFSDDEAIVNRIETEEKVEEVIKRVRNDLLLESDDAEMARITSFVCKCNSTGKENALLRQSCLAKIDPSIIYNNRLRMFAHSEEAKDAFVEAYLFSSTQNGEMTVSTRKTPEKRQRRRTTFTIHSTTVCRDAWLFSIG